MALSFLRSISSSLSGESLLCVLCGNCEANLLSASVVYEGVEQRCLRNRDLGPSASWLIVFDRTGAFLSGSTDPWDIILRIFAHG